MTIESQEAAATSALEIANLTRRFGGVVAVNDVTFDVPQGSIVGVIGPNGAGKTTLLNLITGFIKPTSGTVKIAGHDLTGARPHTVARSGVARTYQNLLLLEDETVYENVRIGRHLPARNTSLSLSARRAHAAREREIIEGLLEELELSRLSSTPVVGLPYGVRRRVEIARALATEPSTLILDEPTAGMTGDESKDIGAIITALRDRGSTVLLVEHNVRLVTDICEEVLVLNWGELIGRDSADRVWELDAVKTAYLGVALDDAAADESHEERGSDVAGN
ncbi:hypothetical protein BH683_025345 [Williamsia sp. 1138]|uniref:ABC transporter ATP-binding protein n=1 Tax=Williamsia sp. 1138 TaxID=1903117 RepID=UPI000A0F9F5D|nr:ATP-binding cassette domain-containing protein [Williamsia sp. 1138]OZG26141.1 hypothetical protein BH683_025345 [Williamsia sp. 1138]